jgi:hypothetical protein
MKKLLLISLCLGFAALANADVFQAGGDRLTALQNNDGGWDWPLNDGVATTVSPKNTPAPITMGLAKAYKQTGNSSYLAALTKAGNLLLSKSGNFSAADGYMAVELDSIFGGTTYTNHVKTNFYDKLANGTYLRAANNTYYSASGYAAYIRNGRAGSQANMGAWDIGMALYAAKAIGADTTAWVDAAKAEIDELSTDNYYDVIGLAGAVLGMAAAGQDFDPTAGSFASASSISDLADMLAALQISNGAFTWNANYVSVTNESVQETAYAILALQAVGGYDSEVAAAQNYLMSVQLATGGWEGYVGGGENNEITGEALWAIPEPATLCILAIGSLVYLRKRK